MDIIIQSLGFKASTDLEAFIHEKLGKLNPNDSIIRANVTLFQGSDSNPTNNYCEIRLEVPGNDHFVKKSSDIFEKSVVEAVDTLQKMLHKSKEKELSRRQG
jgi:putative sigma-54 modulation protein